jgi:Endonuclease/Exonuclease/phosphatase family/PEP-CTERM motif
MKFAVTAIATAAALGLATPAVIAVANPQGVSVRFATFNASLNRDASGQLLTEVALPGIVDITQNWGGGTPGFTAQQRRVLQMHNVAEVMQKVGADVLLVNEFDFDRNGIATADSTPSALGYKSRAADLFHDNFLSVGHGGAATGRSASAPIGYQWRHTPNTNTGIPSGFDLDNNGSIGGGNDAYGFGNFRGQFGFTIYSKYEIVAVRSFQNFLWKDMPGNLLTNDPTAGANNLANFYSADERNQLRLSSKNHVDVQVRINGQIVHFLTAHPTPPVFDGAEDRNGKRNHDEIRLWADYIGGAAYLYDDQGGSGGLAPGAKFVIAGDYNADLCDGDSYKVACLAAGTPGAGPNAIGQLLGSALVNTSMTPASAGGTAAATDPSNNGNANQSHLQDPRFDTADFNDAAPGNLRVDYVLPSATLATTASGVFWPTRNDADFALVGTFGNQNLYAGFPTSDHKAVWVDVTVVPEPATWALLLGGLAAIASRVRRR